MKSLDSQKIKKLRQYSIVSVLLEGAGCRRPVPGRQPSKADATAATAVETGYHFNKRGETEKPYE